MSQLGLTKNLKLLLFFSVLRELSAAFSLILTFYLNQTKQNVINIPGEEKSIIIITVLKRWVVYMPRTYCYFLVQFDSCILMLSLPSVSIGKGSWGMSGINIGSTETPYSEQCEKNLL